MEEEKKKVEELREKENFKDSIEYFMCHMTQEEFEERAKGIEPVRDFKFNIINK